MSELIPNTSLTNLLGILQRNPLLALSRCRDRYQGSAKAHHEAIYDIIAFVVGFVLRLEESKHQTQDFLTLEYWRGKPHAPKEKNLSRYATMYVIGAKESKGALYDQALIYTKVVDYYLGINIEPNEIPAKLKEKGIYKLLDEILAKKENSAEADENKGGCPAYAKESGSASSSISSDAEVDDLLDGEPPHLDDAGDKDGEENKHDDDKVQPKARRLSSTGVSLGSGGNDRRDRPLRRFDPKEHVAIRGGTYLGAILALRAGERLWVCVERADDGGFLDWKDLVAVNVEQPEPPEGPHR